MLYITLGGGFDRNRVALALDARPVFDSAEVSSSPLLDLATELPPLDASAPGSELAVVVTGPGGEEVDRARFTLPAGDDLYVVIYLDRSGEGPGRLKWSIRDSPFAFG